MTRFTLWPIAAGWMLLALFSGCRSISPPVVYYTLSPIAGEAAVMDAHGAQITRIGIRSVALPGIISRTQMVRQSGPNRVEISSFNRWADYPDRLVQRVLEQNLTLLLPNAQVVSAPWPAGFQPDIAVSLQFIELIGTVDKKMRLTVDWTFSAKGDATQLETYRRSFIETMPGTGFDDLAAAHSRVLETLCREIADTLAEVSAR